MLFVLKLLLVFLRLLFILSLLGRLVLFPSLITLAARLVFFLLVFLISLIAERCQFSFGYPVSSQDIIDASKRLILDLIVVFVVLFHEISMLQLLQNSLEHLDFFEENVKHRVLVEISKKTAALDHSDGLFIP